MRILALLLALFFSSFALAQTQTQSQLPPGMEQFADGNGAPYAGGKLFLYFPFTTTPKASYKDPYGSVPNTNPIVLDGNGRAIIWGNGLYREVLQDSFGNVIWDQQSGATAGGQLSSGALSCATTTTTGTANAQIVTPSPAVTSLVVGNVYCAVAGFSNTGPMSLQIGALVAEPVKKQSPQGLQVLAGGEIVVGQGYLWQWDGVEFQILNSSNTNTYPVIDLAGLGAVGDGSTNNNSSFATAFSEAAVAGGMMRIPCGVYLLTATPTATVPSGANISLVGSGADCTVLKISGAVNGPTFTYTNQWSSVRVSDLTIETDQSGGTSAIVLASTAINNAEAFSAQTILQNLTLRGADNYPPGSNTNYWGIGISESNISNIVINNILSNGVKATPSGNFLNLTGYGAGSIYSVQISLSNVNVNYCSTGVSYGDWVQGVQIVNLNVTGCNSGVVVVASPSGGLSQLAVANSQFDTFNCGVCVNDGAFANAQIVNSQFIAQSGSIAVKVSGSNFVVTGNEMNSVGNAAQDGIAVGTTFGNGGNIANNQILGFTIGGIVVGAGSQAAVKLTNNQFNGNTVDYSINSSSRGTIIVDTQPRDYATVPACNAATAFGSYQVADLPSATFNTTVTVGGSNNFLGMKCDGTRNYVD